VDGELTIRAAPDRLRRLFENRFRNAVEHGGDEVAVRIGALGDGRGFYVEDDGLAIAASVVRAHDWQIAITDAEEGGTRFEISDVVVLDPVLN